MPEHLIGRHLMESAPRTNRGVRLLMLSTAVHAAALAVSLSLTLEARPNACHSRGARRRGRRRHFHPTPTPSPQTASNAQLSLQVLNEPLEVSTSLSLAALRAPSTIPEDFSGRGVAEGHAPVIVAAPAVMVARDDEPIEGALADQPPYLLPDQMGPTYPPSLRDRAPDGLVVVRFVIDTLGRVEPPSLDIVRSSHPLFLASVRTALDHLRFLPGRFSGRRVRVRMEQRFEFHLAGH
jgi:Gram-negative bacterial TonB protein C-terminal